MIRFAAGFAAGAAALALALWAKAARALYGTDPEKEEEKE